MGNYRTSEQSQHIKKWISESFPKSKGLNLLVSGLSALTRLKSNKRVKIRVLSREKNYKPELITVIVDKGKEFTLFQVSDIKEAKRYLKERIKYFDNF